MTIFKDVVELLHNNDCVILPGFGAFVLKNKSASIIGNEFIPPRKDVSFNAMLKENDGLLVKHISKTRETTYKKALGLVEKEIKAALRRRHRISPQDERAIGSFNLGEVFTRIMGFSNGMTFISLIVGIATIIAGVIGIGNILLISVKERTKELGVRRALGATPGEVRNQIILESVFLTIVAGIMGIILGALVLAGINLLTQDLSTFPYTNPTVPIPLILGALFIMIFLGTLIGLIPAQRAVSIKPIDALREE